MSSRHSPSEFEIQETIYLGAKISDEKTEFKEWALMEPDVAFMIWLLEHPNASLIDMLKVHANLEFLKSTTEVTKLSMAVGTESGGADVKEQIERIRSSVSNP